MTDINKEVSELKSQISLLEDQIDEILTEAQSKINKLNEEKTKIEKVLEGLENEKLEKAKKEEEAKKIVDESKEIIARIEQKTANIRNLFK